MGVFNKVIVNDSEGNTLYQLKPNLPLSYYNTSNDIADFNVKTLRWGFNKAVLYLSNYWNCGDRELDFELGVSGWNFYALSLDDIRDPTLPYPARWQHYMRLQMKLEVGIDAYSYTDRLLTSFNSSFGASAYTNRDNYPGVGEADLLNVQMGTSYYTAYHNFTYGDSVSYVKFRYFKLIPQFCIFGQLRMSDNTGFFTGRKGIATMHLPLVGAYSPDAPTESVVTSYCNVTPVGDLSYISDYTMDCPNVTSDKKFSTGTRYDLGPFEFTASIDSNEIYYRKQVTLL